MPTGVSRILGDMVYLGSLFVVIVSVERKKSCAGWSGRMHILTEFTYVARYWMVVDSFESLYDVLSHLAWIAFSAYILFLIYIKYSDTYEKKCDTFWIESIILACLAAAFIFCNDLNAPEEIASLYSYFNESLSVIPQCYFVFIKRRKDLIVTYYVIAQAYYKLLHIGDWLIIYYNGGELIPYKLYPGLVQVFLHGVYFLLPRGKVEREESVQAPESIKGSLQRFYLTQGSLLETPLLKRSISSLSSIYVISDNVSDSSSIHRSESSASDMGRY